MCSEAKLLLLNTLTLIRLTLLIELVLDFFYIIIYNYYMKRIAQFFKSLFPPFLIIFRINKVIIPIPFLLFWPFVILILLIAQLIIPFIDIKGTKMKQRAQWPWLAYRILCISWGTRIQVNEKKSKVLIFIW